MGDVVEREPYVGIDVIHRRDPNILVLHALRWIGAHREEWEQLLDLCSWFHDTHPSLTLRRGDLWVYAGQKGLSVSTCKAYKFDNSIWSTLSRLCIMFRPELSACIHPRKCPIDDMRLDLAWQLILGDAPDVAITDWREAFA